MTLNQFYQRLSRRLVLASKLGGFLRKCVFISRGARIGRRTILPPRTMATWPHQIQLGDDCILQPDIFFNYDHYWMPGPSIVIGDKVFIGRGCEFNIREKLTVGDKALIASGCTFVDHDHGRDSKTGIINESSPGAPIVVGRGAWIGANCTILKGVSIGENSVVGAGAVVTKSVPNGQVWVGNPARCVYANVR